MTERIVTQENDMPETEQSAETATVAVAHPKQNLLYPFAQQIPMTKDGQEILAKRIADAVTNGDVSAIEALVQIRAASEVIDHILKRLKDSAIDEMHGDKSVTTKGVRISVAHRTSWAFDDSKLDEIKKAQKELATQKKERETMLKSLTEELVDPETGEFLKPGEPSYSEILRVEFPKQ